jgi:DNA-binding XRE family transcriptional regulator
MAINPLFFYIVPMSKRVELSEKDLATLAKKYREAAGKNRAQAARELNVSRQSVIYAEDSPEQSLLKLRKRIIETYSPHKVIGPVFWLEQK